MEPGYGPKSEIGLGGFAMLDSVLMPRGSEQELLTAVSIREGALASDHFIVYCTLHCEIEQKCEVKRIATELTVLQRPEAR